VTMLPDEKEGRPGDYTETADLKTSHQQATSATDSSGVGGHCLSRVNILRTHAKHRSMRRSTARSDPPKKVRGHPRCCGPTKTAPHHHRSGTRANAIFGRFPGCWVAAR
jgi:hypothetical protein